MSRLTWLQAAGMTLAALLYTAGLRFAIEGPTIYTLSDLMESPAIGTAAIAGMIVWLSRPRTSLETGDQP